MKPNLSTICVCDCIHIDQLMNEQKTSKSKSAEAVQAQRKYIWSIIQQGTVHKHLWGLMQKGGPLKIFDPCKGDLEKNYHKFSSENGHAFLWGWPIIFMAKREGMKFLRSEGVPKKLPR